MTNQTIDGVPRSTLEKALIDAMGSRARHSPHIADLRALLDAERCTSCDDSGDLIDLTGEWRGYCVCPAGVALKNKPAAQPQGEPVVHMELVENKIYGGMHIVKRDNPGGLKEGFHRLYAEQPAPVAAEQTSYDSVDFRLLLNKYIEHVGQCEGVDFISYIGGSYGSNVPFDLAEIAELKRLQGYPMKVEDATPNDPDPSTGLTPKGSAKFTYRKAVWCTNCGDSEKVVFVQGDKGALMGPCPHCRPKPPPAGSDRISMEGAIILCGGAPNPITYTGNGAIVNLNGYTLYAPGAEPVAVVLPERMSLEKAEHHTAPVEIHNGVVTGWNACLDELKRLNPYL